MAEKKSKLAEIKTKPSDASVNQFINDIKDEQKRKDSFAIIELMKKISGEDPVLWGTAMIGFGNKRYVSPKTGRAVDWMKIGFSPRKANISLYLTTGVQLHEEAFKKLGKHKTGVGCLYINKLEDVDLGVLKNIIEVSYRHNNTND